jgi:hypothetical protein
MWSPLIFAKNTKLAKAICQMVTMINNYEG